MVDRFEQVVAVNVPFRTWPAGGTPPDARGRKGGRQAG
jgi:hypothetical protein